MAAKPSPIEQLQAQLAALADAVALMQPGAPENPVSKPASRVRGKAKAAARKPASRKPANPYPHACITAGDAWVLLGADPSFEPREPGKPANARQLWVLNSTGKLAEAFK